MSRSTGGDPGIAWFDDGYRRRLARRYATFALAFERLLAHTGSSRIIVETGCVREKDDYSAGYSTVLFGELLSRRGGRLYTVDISERNMAICKKITRRFASSITYTVGDSVTFLKTWSSAPDRKPIDLLYLDSFDYPVYSTPDEQAASQKHCLLELEAALPALSPNAIVLIDDGDLPGGGKPRLANERLRELGWTLEIEDYQSLWSAPVSG